MTDFLPDLCYKGANASWLFSGCVSVVLLPTIESIVLRDWRPASKSGKSSHNVVTYKTNFHVHFDACANFDALRSHKPILMANGHAQSRQVYQNSE
jgi:hypothetical protein